MHIAFYAPLKSPDHPVPSGDRLMARLLTQAMRHAGYTVTLASQFRSYAPSAENFEARYAAGEGGSQAARRRMAHARRTRSLLLLPPLLQVARLPRSSPLRRVWHSLRNGGGLLFVAARGGCVGSGASAGGERPWQGRPQYLHHRAETVRGLEKIVDADRLAMLPAFLDVAPFSPSTGSTPPRLVTVAMMRPGDKLESYHMLAAALKLCTDLPWTLTVVGDGPCREEVGSLFAALPHDRIEWSRGTAADGRARVAGAGRYLRLARLWRSVRLGLS